MRENDNNDNIEYRAVELGHLLGNLMIISYYSAFRSNHLARSGVKTKHAQSI